MERLESNHGFVVRSGSVSGWIGLYRTQQPDAMASGAAPLRKRHGSASPFAEAFVGGHGRHGAVENVTRQALWHALQLQIGLALAQGDCVRICLPAPVSLSLARLHASLSVVHPWSGERHS